LGIVRIANAKLHFQYHKHLTSAVALSLLLVTCRCA